ncbi:MAG: response regulator [Ignavibacteriaceae bacterium]
MKKVLVVDDSSFVRTYHKSILQQGNYLSEAASNGAEALEKSLSIDYDLILCDINMLIMDGITFIQKYRKSGKETPIIIITSIEESHQKSIGFEAGANVYVTKPVEPELLLENVRMLLGE